MMASNNDDTRKKQKRAAVDSIVIVDGNLSSSSTPVHVISLSLGNILQQFPDFLLQLLPYIADRTIFNAIASCNRDINETSKVILPPWPNFYHLPFSNYLIAVWSPDGTRVAYTGRHVITIVDQRRGIIHRINSNGTLISTLKFSPDGKLLVSAGRDGIVRLWDTVTGNYEQSQEWNITEDFGTISILDCFNIDISACSKYIVVATSSTNHVVLINVEKGETVRSLTLQPVMKNISKVMFSMDRRVVFICGWESTGVVSIKLWCSYLDNTDEDNVITLWEHHQNRNPYLRTKIIPSHEKTMIAIQNTSLNHGWLLSIDSNYSCTVQELNIQVSDEKLLQFTPDDKFIIYATKNGLKYWSVAKRKFMNNTFLFYNKTAMNNLPVVNCSPNIRQLIVKDNYQGGRQVHLYIKSVL